MERTDHDYIYHHGIKGMKWGIRRTKEQLGYKSTGIRAAFAKRSNDKIDKGFKNWKENAAKRDNAIDLGKKANASRMAYEGNRKDKSLKKTYKEDSRAYKKALKSNTTYRKGVVKKEVGSDMSRKYLSEAKRVKKQLQVDPTNKELRKKYNQLMSSHDIERAKARRAPMVAANRSQKIASMKRAATMTVKGAATTAAVSAGVYAVNRYLLNGRLNLNAEQVINFAKAGRKVADFL